MEFREDWSFFFFLSSLFAVVTSNALADHILRDPETAGHLSVVGTIEQLLDRSQADGADQGLQFRRMFRLCGVLAQSKKVDSGLQSATGWMESAEGVKLFGRAHFGRN